uniref:ABC transporter domain-containing protein n=1 Tax=Biomphalaria glabrata TaxID=6526 RepID=A0A2C9LNW9_BIOGL
MFIMTEYKHGFLRLQHISGMSHLDYFLSNFLFDFVLHTVEGFLICISLVWIRRYPAPMIYDASGFFVVIVLSALASLPCVYSIQMLFPSFKTFLCTYLLGRFSLDLFSMAIVGVFPAAMSIQDIRHILLRALYPPFNVFIELYSSCTRRSRPLQLMSEQFYSNNCTGEWSLLFPLQYVMFITLQFATWLLLVCIASAVSTLRKSSFCRSCLKALYLVNPTAFKETEVMNELIFIKDFQTIIKTAPHLVPNCNIRNNMVYGLIEPTGYVKMAFMRKFIHYYAKSLCRHRTGYCPHDVALLDKLTCFETLKLFGRLRGLGTDDLYSQIKAFVAMLQFNSILHRRVSQINVQDKKKLYVAIALIGNPAILILDEPAELLDSMTTNLVWGMLRYLSRGHRFILIATKHAKGCENVCTNLSILFSNQLVVQSDTENLAVKYFHGYTAILKFSFINGQRSEHLKMCFLGLSDIFQDVEIYSDDKCTHVYFSSDDTDVSKLFAFLEDSKVYYSLWDYTITPTRLGEISYYLAVKATEQIIEILPDF